MRHDSAEGISGWSLLGAGHAEFTLDAGEILRLRLRMTKVNGSQSH